MLHCWRASPQSPCSPGTSEYDFSGNGLPRCLRCYRICLQLGDLGSIPGPGRSPWRRDWQPTPTFLPGEFHGQRSLVGYSPGGHKESDTPERLILSIPFKWSAWLGSILQWEISGTKLCKPLWTCSMSHSTFSIQCTNLYVCVCVSVAFWPFLT